MEKSKNSLLYSLKKAESLNDLAKILSMPLQALTYILYASYKTKTSNYTQFEIPKKNGGTRKINAPVTALKKVQKKLASILQNCLEQLYTIEGHRTHGKEKEIVSISHGFMRGKSIISNATPHRKKRFVLNIDIENFFESFHYGRIYGFFTKNKHFKLNEIVARAISNIVCYQGKLPQGAPTSPVISNLISGPLDIRLTSLAKKYKLYYTRYADDLSFSSSITEFPSNIAKVVDNEVIVGSSLKKIVEKQGFKINNKKTRLQYKNSRQEVTGLVVNEKINIRKEYRDKARILWHKIKTGKEIYKIEAATEDVKDINYLIGVLGHIYNVRRSNNLRQNKKLSTDQKNPKKQDIDKALDTYSIIYRDAIFYKNCIINTEPSILCEGKTDIIYLRSALLSLASKHKTLIEQGKIKINFIKPTKTLEELFRLGGGTSGMASFIRLYKDYCKVFDKFSFKSPVIMIIDNDSGRQPIETAIKSFFNKEFSKTKEFLYITKNLYIIQTPLVNGNDSDMESFFDEETKKIKLDGKSFTPKNSGFDKNKFYGKNYFAEYVVKANRTKINFEKFNPLLENIKKVIRDYRKRLKNNTLN